MKLKFKAKLNEERIAVKCESESDFERLINHAIENQVELWYGEPFTNDIEWWGPETCVSLFCGWVQDYESMKKEQDMKIISFEESLEEVPFKYKYKKLTEEKENEKIN